MSVYSCVTAGVIVCTLQPFPRVEFGEEHAQMSLKDLNLVPNGSLVVKVTNTPTVVPTGQNRPSVLIGCKVK